MLYSSQMILLQINVTLALDECNMIPTENNQVNQPSSPPITNPETFQEFCQAEPNSTTTISNSTYTVDLDFYNNLMTPHDEKVTVTCCTVYGTTLETSCGQGKNCRAACFALDANLCPTGDCRDCYTFANEPEGRQEGRSYYAGNSESLRGCYPKCNVNKKSKRCCLHPECRKKKKNKKKCKHFRIVSGDSL